MALARLRPRHHAGEKEMSPRSVKYPVGWQTLD